MSYITLTKKVTMDSEYRHRMQVWVSEHSDDLLSTVFVYQRLPSVPSYDKLADIFAHVASYADISDYPENSPSSDSPFFRKYYIDLIFDNLPLLDRTWELIEGMVKLTVEDICKLNAEDSVELNVITA